MSGEKCESCRFFYEHSPKTSGSGSTVHGSCRRHPPAVIQKYVSHDKASVPETTWPLVATDDWCGDFALEHLSPEPTPA